MSARVSFSLQSNRHILLSKTPLCGIAIKSREREREKMKGVLDGLEKVYVLKVNAPFIVSTLTLVPN